MPSQCILKPSQFIPVPFQCTPMHTGAILAPSQCIPRPSQCIPVPFQCNPMHPSTTPVHPSSLSVHPSATLPPPAPVTFGVLVLNGGVGAVGGLLLAGRRRWGGDTNRGSDLAPGGRGGGTSPAGAWQDPNDAGRCGGTPPSPRPMRTPHPRHPPRDMADAGGGWRRKAGAAVPWCRPRGYELQ